MAILNLMQINRPLRILAILLVLGCTMPAAASSSEQVVVEVREAQEDCELPSGPFDMAYEEAAVAADIAESRRPIIGSYRIEIGKRFDFASYLSPFSYSGTNVALSGFWAKVMPRHPQSMAMTFDGRANFGNLLNPAGTAREIDLHAQFRWGLEWQRRFAGQWLVSVGGNAGVYGGMVYLPRNGNNPAAAQFAIGIGAQAYASKLVRIGRLPVLISDRLALPLAGAFFCQQYGESYYEIYLGNRKGLAHFGWPGNRFGIDNLLMVTFDFGTTAMELGYRFSFQNEQANRLTTRFTSHSLVIGVIPGSIGVKAGKRNEITPLF